MAESDRSAERTAWILQRARELVGALGTDRPAVLSDTSDFMSIERDHVLELEGRYFLVRGNEREGRFGLDDQPKFWVKRALALDSGQTYVIKLEFREEFDVRIGPRRIHCTRSGEKEGAVLARVCGDLRFMQGRTVRDVRGNFVRVIEFIEGTTLLDQLFSLAMTHEEYCETILPGVVAHAIESLQAIADLHAAGLCHGDIRNDHLFIERSTGRYRWIDFDLHQDSFDFDLWRVGNILHCAAGKGIVRFSDAHVQGMALDFAADDASALLRNRVMNLRKVFPHLPAELNKIIQAFSVGTRVCYDRVQQVVDDLGNCATVLGWPTAPGPVAPDSEAT